MKRNALRALKNPLVIVPPFVIILGVGWHQYTYAGRNLTLPTPGINLLPNSEFADFSPSGMPTGWRISMDGVAHYETARSSGYANGSSLKVGISDYQSGDTSITSPKVDVRPGTTYLFKGYYTTSTELALLARYYYADGSSVLNFVRTYPGHPGVWSTASDAFAAPANATAVQFVYRLYANGSLQLNDFYLEPRQNVYIPPVISPHNIIPNSELQSGDYTSPQGWSTYHTGNNTAAFSYTQDAPDAYVQTQVSSYHDGEAKWQYPSQIVHAHEYYQFSLEYQSNSSVPLVAEYTLGNGQRQDQTITNLPPADQWTTMTSQFEVPPGAVAVFLSAPLQHTGTIATRNYTLTDITKSNAAHWQHAVVSLAFDNGWEQTYKNVLPILQQDGIAATFYVNPSTIETSDFMTASELDTLKQDGYEIGSQGYNRRDMTAINDTALTYQLRQSRDYLQAAGFSVTDFAAPYGLSDAEVHAYAQDYYATLIGGQSGINTLQNMDPYDLKVLNVNASTNPKTVMDAIKVAEAENGWLILDYQLVGNDALATKQGLQDAVTSPTAFRQQIDAIRTSGVHVLPVATAYVELQKQ